MGNKKFQPLKEFILSIVGLLLKQGERDASNRDRF